MSLSHRTPRRFPRVPASRPMLVRLLGERRQFEELTHTETIGLGGCMFVSPEPVGYGALMEVLISFRGGVARTDGRVVWERPRRGPWAKRANDEDGDRVEVGIEFLRLNPADRRLLAPLFRGSETAESAPKPPT